MHQADQLASVATRTIGYRPSAPVIDEIAETIDASHSCKTLIQGSSSDCEAGLVIASRSAGRSFGLGPHAFGSLLAPVELWSRACRPAHGLSLSACRTVAPASHPWTGATGVSGKRDLGLLQHWV